MTDEEFEQRVQQVMKEEGLPEFFARIHVSVQAGEGGDVVGDGIPELDPRDQLASLPDWGPKPSKEDKDVRPDRPQT